MNDSTRRGIRTAVDAILMVLVSLTAVFAIPGLQDQMESFGLGKALSMFGLMVLVLLTFFTTLKNKLEDNGTIPALLKTPSSSDETAFQNELLPPESGQVANPNHGMPGPYVPPPADDAEMGMDPEINDEDQIV